ncbi:MAG: cyclase family protein [Desulfarculaceae bacterium]|nr:cyclase family protein [Desulfarculaceae bacterium]
MKIIDISLTMQPGMPVWPGDPSLEISRVQDLAAGDPATVSKLCCGAHAGTHVDAPGHFLPQGAMADQLALPDLVGPALVIDVGPERRITPQRLALPPGTERVLIKSRNSALWSQESQAFREDFAALTVEAAAHLVAQGVRLVGADYLSVQLFDDPTDDTHRILLEAGVVILEGLNLAPVSPGVYFLACLPLKLAGCEGAPARAVLWEE